MVEEDGARDVSPTDSVPPDRAVGLPLPPRAIALSYDPARPQAPRVTAQGSGPVARRIIELARQHDVPIREDPLLVQALSSLDLGQKIPPELYQVVAELFVWLYSLDQERRAG